MLFSRPVAQLPKIATPTAAEVAVKSKPSPEGKALITPGMTPSEHLHALEKNKLSMDSVGLLAHGLPPMDAICWACQGCRLVGPKLSMPEMDLLKLTEAWLRNPLPDLLASISASMLKVDFTGPASWSAQAALWVGVPGMVVAAAVIGAILLAAGLKVGVAMPPIPKPRLALPMLPLPPEMLLQLKMPQIVIPIPVLDQPKLMKLLFPFIDLGKGVAIGSIRCS